MRKDLVTVIATALAGILVAYLIVSNFILKAPTPVEIKILDTSSTTKLDDPSPEIFNYRALNPTVETYIDCTNYDIDGNCPEAGGEE